MIKNKKIYLILQIILFGIYIGLMVFFTLKCLENGAKSTESSQKVVEASAEVVNVVRPNNPVSADNPSFQTFIRKFIGHYGFFVVLGLVSSFFYLSLRRVKKIPAIILHFEIGLLFAFISEFVLESQTEGRNASWGDVGIDALGFLTLSVIVIIVYYVLKNRRKGDIHAQ